MTEQKLVKDFLNFARLHEPRGVFMKHADRWTKAIPDVSLDLNHRTSWWEFKYTDGPKLRGHVDFGLQREMCCRLERAGTCYYVVYSSVSPRSVSIVKPSHVEMDRSYRPLGTALKFDHLFVLDKMREAHGLSIGYERGETWVGVEKSDDVV